MKRRLLAALSLGAGLACAAGAPAQTPLPATAAPPPAVSPAPAVIVSDPGLPALEMATEPGAGEAGATPNPYAGDLFTRQRMTGDWGGARSALAERGLTFDTFLTQFFQDVASGGREQTGRYGGKLDYLANLDGGKAGLWQGFFVNFHAETRYGRDVNNIDGLLAPANLPMSFPRPDENITAITGLKFTQALSENFAVYFGKINTLDEYNFRFSPGLGTNRPGLDGFLNTSLVFNPIVGRTVPYATAGAGFAVLSEGEPLFAVTVFDPEERAARGMDDLFARGAVLVADLTLRTELFGRPGKYNFGGTWSSATYRSFDPAAYYDIPPALILDDRFAPRETGSWCLYHNFFQAFWADPENKRHFWGVFGQFGISDGNPNPIRFVANGGLAAQGALPGRPYDTFGVGYFYLGLSNNFKTLAEPIQPQQDEHGVELFYNYAITPWARLTGDLQVARPSTVGFDRVIIPGLRFQLLF